MTRDNAIAIARFCFEHRTRPDLHAAFEPADWVIEAIRLGASAGPSLEQGLADAAVFEALEHLCDPEGQLSCINPGPERDALQRALDKVRALRAGRPACT